MLELLITGIPSSGKAHLEAALVTAGFTLSRSNDALTGCLRVHAETDLEALVEPSLLSGARADRAAAHVVVPVDWERVADSVRRVQALARKAV